MRRSRQSAGPWADGIMWDSREEYEQALEFAVEVTGPDIQLIDQLVRHCEQALRRGRPDMMDGYTWQKEERRQNLVSKLYERAGAATALGDTQTAPLTLAEIRQLELIRHDIQYLSTYYLFGQRDPMLDQADDLLHRLHFLAGHARATGSAGGVTVFPAGQLPAAW